MIPYRHNIRPASDIVRPWPWPYEAGMTISNDAEFMSFDFFETLMAFLNGKGRTPLGNGLGLAVSSSMFFYSANAYNFSYFNGSVPTAAPGLHIARIHDYIKSGHIDTIHAYGDFDGVGGFERRHAENSFNALQKNNLSMDVFTNHGGTENWQNVGADAEYHRGDVTGHPAYHADLLKDNGVRYVWTDSLTTLKPDPKRRLKQYIKKAIGKGAGQESSLLLKNISLQDSSVFKGFMRFRSTGANAPNLSSLKSQMDQIEWSRFYRNNQAMVIYQHLGVLERVNGKCTAATVEAMMADPGRYLSGFYALKREKDSGRLWLAGTSDFLNYFFMVESTSVTPDGIGRFVIANEHCWTDPEKFFQGLTVYTAQPDIAEILWNGKVIPHIINAPDKTERASITIPFIPKETPWP